MPGRLRMALVGGAQGLALWALFEPWPEGPRVEAVAFALATFVVASGLVLHMARTGRDPARLAAIAAATGLVFGLVSLWVGWQMPGEGAPYRGDGPRLFHWGIAAGVALYGLGPFLQILQSTGRARFPYEALYRNAWSNAFVAALGALFTAALWTVLLLWGLLFGLIGIEFFGKLFDEPLFAAPATGAALGYGLAVSRERESLIDTLRGLAQSLFAALLPVLAAVTVGFVAALPATGLAPLFDTPSATGILSAWTAGFVLLLNAVYQDGSGAPPYGAALRRVVEGGTLALVALTAIALYALHLRLDQYGLTPNRMLALVVALLLAAYALAYAGAVLRGGAPWLPALRPVNVALAGLVIVVALALHTPLLDPLRWSVRSQVARVTSGEVAPEDFAFLRFRLGHRGHAALERLAEHPPGPEPDRSAERIAAALEAESYFAWQEAEEEEAAAREGPAERPPELAAFAERFALLPEERSWPEGLREALRAEEPGRPGLQRCARHERCPVFAADLDGDGKREELVAAEHEGSHELLDFARAADGGWQLRAVLRPRVRGDGEKTHEGWRDAIREGRVRTVAPRYRALAIDGRRFRVVAEPGS